MAANVVDRLSDTSVPGLIAWLLILGAIAGGVALAGFGIVNAIGADNITDAVPYTSVLAPGATLILVGLTGWYVRETQQLRIQERRRAETERQRTRRNVRRAFRAEVGAVENLEELAENRSADQIAKMRRIVPTSMYDQNCAQLGILTSDEVGAIVDYYGTAQSIEDLAYSHRTDEDTDASDALKMKLGELRCYQSHALDAIDMHLEQPDEAVVD